MGLIEINAVMALCRRGHEIPRIAGRIIEIPLLHGPPCTLISPPRPLDLSAVSASKIKDVGSHEGDLRAAFADCKCLPEVRMYLENPAIPDASTTKNKAMYGFGFKVEGHIFEDDLRKSHFHADVD